MDNNADSNKNDGLPQDGIVMPPQDFLNFLGHLSHGAVIGAVTTGALKDNHDNLLQAIKDGDMDEVRRQADLLREGINLAGIIVCRLGKGLSKHDEMVFNHCIKNGVKVTSKTQGLLKEMHKDVSKFIKDFLEEDDVSHFTDVPPHKRNPADKPKDKPTDRPKGPSDRFPEGFDFGGSQNTDN